MNDVLWKELMDKLEAMSDEEFLAFVEECDKYPNVPFEVEEVE